MKSPTLLRFSISTRALTLTGLLALLLATSASATPGWYTNTTAGNWSTTANWSAVNGAPPAAGGAFTNIVFNPSSATQGNNTNDLGSSLFTLNQMWLIGAFATTNTSVNSLVFTNGTGTALISNNVAFPLVINSTIVLGTNLNIGAVASGTIILNSNISQSVAAGSGLTKYGAGTLILTASNSYTGNTTLSAGTLEVDNNNALGTGLVTLAGGVLTNNVNGTVLTNIINQSASMTIGIPAATTNIFGGFVTNNAATLTKLGLGTLVLTNLVTVVGGINDNAGTLVLNGGTVNTGSGTGMFYKVDTGGTLVIGNQVILYGNTSQFSVGVSSSSSGTVNQTNGLVQFINGTGTGTDISLGFGSSASGIYNLSGGTINSSTGNANYGVTLGYANSSSGTFNLTGTGTLNLASAVLNIARSIPATGVTNATGIFNQTNGTATISELRMGGADGYSVSNKAQLNLYGGTFIATNLSYLSAGQYCTSSIAISGGDLTVNSFPTTHGAGSAATFTINGGVLRSLTPVNPTATNSSLTFMGGLTAAYIQSGGATINTANGSITISQNLLTDPTLTGGGLTNAGANTLTLTGINTYTGPTVITAGELVGATGGSSSSSDVTVAAGATNGVQVLAANGQWGCQSLTYSAGTTYADFDFAGFTPSTTTAPLQVVNALTFNSTPTVLVRNLTGVTNGVYPLIKYGSFSGTAPTSFTSAFATGTISNDTSGNVLYLVVTSGNTANNPLLWTAGNGKWDINNTTSWKDTNGVSGKVYLEGTSVILDDTATGATPILVTNTVTVSPAGVTVNVTNKSYTIYGSAIAGYGALTKNGTNTLTLNGTNSYSGGTVVNGGTVVAGNTFAAIGTGLLTLNSGTTLSNRVAGSLLNPINLAGNATLASPSGINITVGNSITNSGSLTLSGASTFTLTGSNTFSGGLSLNCSTLVASSDANLGALGIPITVLASTSVSLGSATYARGIVLSNDITFNSANTPTFTGPVTGSGGVYHGGGNAGSSATLTSVSNTFTGVVGVGTGNGSSSGPILTVASLADSTSFIIYNYAYSSGSAIFAYSANAVVPLALTNRQIVLATTSASAVVNTIKNQNTTYPISIYKNLASSNTVALTLGLDAVAGPINLFAGNIGDGTGAGVVTLTKSSAGTWALTGTNTYSGGTTISAGILEADNNLALGTGLLSISATLSNNVSATLTNRINLAAASTVGVGSGQTLTLGGVITNTFALTKTGAGTLTLTNANTYSGGTTITLGILEADNNTALGTGKLVMNGGMLSNNVTGVVLTNIVNLSSNSTIGLPAGVNFTLGGVITNSGALVMTGLGTLTLTNINTYTNTTTVSAGTLAVNGSLAPASKVTISSGGTLGGRGTVQGVITNNGVIAPGGAGSIGTLTLTNLLAGTGTIAFDLTSPDLAGATYDQINGGGTLKVVLSGATTIQLNATSGTLTNGTFYLITNTASLTGGQFVFTNGLTTQTNGMTLLRLNTSSNSLVLNVIQIAPPTQLAFTSVPVNPQIGVPFSVTVTEQDSGGTPQSLTNNTTVTLSRGSGIGTLGGTLVGIIPAGSTSVTFASLSYDTAETMTLTATVTAGVSLTPANTNITFTPVPTKLAITSVNGGSNPYAGAAFNVVLQSQDGTSTPQNVVSNTVVSLAMNVGTNAYLNLPLTGTILAGTNSVTITNVSYSQPGTNVSLAATRISGDTLTSGISAAFNVLANTNKNILTFSIQGYGGTFNNGTNITVTLPPYTVVTNLTPIYTVSSYATGSPASGVARNFTTNQLYTITAQDGSQQIYLAAVSVMTANAFNWTNTVSDNWSSAVNWTNNFSWPGAPINTGDATYALNFNKSSTNNVTATNDLNNGFLLNQLNLGGPTLTLTGNSLTFTNNSTALPQINQNSNVNVTINNNIGLGTDLTIGGAGSGQIVAGNQISGTGALIKNTTGTLNLNYGTNTFSGGIIVNAGSLSLGGTANNMLGTGLVTLNSGVTLNLNGNNNITNAMALNGAKLVNGNSFSANLNGPITLTGTNSFDFGTTGNIGIGGKVSGSGGITKLGTSAGSFTITGSNTFSGTVAINAGNLTVASLNSVSGGKPTSNLGAPTNAAGGTISLGSTTTTGNLNYTGPGETTDRIIQLGGTTGGGTITQQGTAAGLPVTQTGQSGLLKFTSNLSVPGVAGQDNRKTLTLTSAETATTAGFIAGQGEISGSIGDSVLGTNLATSVTKAGYGTWTLSGSNSYSGTTTIQAGKLVCVGTNALGGGPVVITDSDVITKLELDFVGLRPVASLKINGVFQPNGIYGSSSSSATTKDDVHFAGPGAVLIGALTSATTNTLALTGGTNPCVGGAALTFTATVTGGNWPSGSVVFYDGVTPLGTNALDGSAQASFSVSTLTGGTHTLTALYFGNSSNAPSASASLAQTVVDSRPATTVALALTAGSNPSSLGSAVTYTATVTGTTPTGTVVFYNGSNTFGSAVLNGSAQASLVVNNLPAGWNGISATYLGDANNATATSTVTWQTVKPATGNGKLKVFILAGQSNMQGKGQVELGRDPNNTGGAQIIGGLGTLRNMLNKNPNKYGYLVDTNPYANVTNLTAVPDHTTTPGWLTLTNVWVSYFSSASAVSSTNEARKGYLDADFGNSANNAMVGPEYGFGLVMGSQLGDPVLIIKTAWGGNSLAGDYLPPSSRTTGTNIQPSASLVSAPGAAYSNMVANVHTILNNLTNEFSTNFSYNPAAGYEIVGFGWHQGWNDIGEPQQQYEVNLVNLIHDVRAEFGVPKLPVVIGVTGMASASGNQLLICAAQAAVANPVLHPELAGTVFTVDTRPFDYGQILGCSAENFHWYHNAESYFNIGQSMGLGMIKLLSATASVTNNPASSVTTNSATFNASVVWPFAPGAGVVYWDTVDHGTNASAWVNSTLVNAWTNSIPTNQYGVAGDYILAGGSLLTLSATNLSFPANGLTTNTTYYFTFSATNQTVLPNPTFVWNATNVISMLPTNSQILWAPSSQSFTTLSMSVGTPPTPLLPGNAITVSGNTPTFTFNTVSGYIYRVVFKNTLTDTNWAPVIASPNYPAPEGWSAVSSGSPITITDTNAVNQPQRFYRIEVSNP